MLGKRRHLRCKKCHRPVTSRRVLSRQQYKTKTYENWYFSYTCNYCQNKWREQHRALARSYSRTCQDKKRDFVKSVKDKPCMDCNILYPYYVMDFDHRSHKLFNIGKDISRMSLETLIKEIEKCDVVCSNCHRIRTHKNKI